jgi:hypothetical protein
MMTQRRKTERATDLVAVVGAHGGAGTTTVATLLRPARVIDIRVSTRRWVEFANRWASVPLVLVARGTSRGLADAVESVAGADSVGLFPAALVVVGDGWWPEPAAVRARTRMLSDRVGTVIRLPFVPRWRYLDDPLTDEPPAHVAVVVEQIRASLSAANR